MILFIVLKYYATNVTVLSTPEQQQASITTTLNHASMETTVLPTPKNPNLETA
jgi:hypothetical protein